MNLHTGVFNMTTCMYHHSTTIHEKDEFDFPLNVATYAIHDGQLCITAVSDVSHEIVRDLVVEKIRNMTKWYNEAADALETTELVEKPGVPWQQAYEAIYSEGA